MSKGSKVAYQETLREKAQEAYWEKLFAKTQAHSIAKIPKKLLILYLNFSI